MQNYFNYFTEIEEHFQRRRGSLLMLSPLDWALIATWQEAGFPLEAILGGIDATFDKYDARKGKARTRRINGLGYCVQEVLRAVEDMHEAATGAKRTPHPQNEESGFEAKRIASHLRATAAQLNEAQLSEAALSIQKEISLRLEELAEQILSGEGKTSRNPDLEALERTLLVLEDKLFTFLVSTSSEETLVALREQSTRELAPYRSRLQAVQIRQIEQQFLRRQLFETLHLPRLSLFYMAQQ